MIGGGAEAPLAIEFSCACGAAFWAPELLAGHRGRCPGCDAVVEAPRPAPPPAEPVREAAATARIAQATAAPEGPPAFAVVRVSCPCGRQVKAPLRRLESGAARCPSCDRVLATADRVED